jgi:Ulp1 family protease
MTIAEMIKSFESLSEEEQDSLLAILLKKREEKRGSGNGDKGTSQEAESFKEETFWEMTLRFRERMEREGIEFTDEDFADLRDRSPGREVKL